MIDFRPAACQPGRQRAGNGSNHANARPHFRQFFAFGDEYLRMTAAWSTLGASTAMTGWKLPPFGVFLA